MDQYMTPVQQTDMSAGQYAPQQMYPQQTMQPVATVQMMQPTMLPPTVVTDEFVAAPAAAAASKPAAIPDWVRDALVIAAVTAALSHPTARSQLSQWLPMLNGDRRDTAFGLVILGLLVGAGSVAVNRFAIQRM